MSLLYSTLLLLGLVLAILLPIALSQFDKPKNANKFVDSVSLSLCEARAHSLRWSVFQMIEQVVNASNSTILLADEQFLVVVDLLVFRPELDLQVMTVTQQQRSRPLKFRPSSCSDTLLWFWPCRQPVSLSNLNNTSIIPDI